MLLSSENPQKSETFVVGDHRFTYDQREFLLAKSQGFEPSPLEYDLFNNEVVRSGEADRELTQRYGRGNYFLVPILNTQSKRNGYKLFLRRTQPDSR